MTSHNTSNGLKLPVQLYLGIQNNATPGMLVTAVILMRLQTLVFTHNRTQVHTALPMHQTIDSQNLTITQCVQTGDLPTTYATTALETATQTHPSSTLHYIWQSLKQHYLHVCHLCYCEHWSLSDQSQRIRLVAVDALTTGHIPVHPNACLQASTSSLAQRTVAGLPYTQPSF